MGFNRYMVECKFDYFGIGMCSVISFNRYMVECKYKFMASFIRVNAVLIDTWWNVNYFCWRGQCYYYSVLIDTWWNVNDRPNDFMTPSIFVLIDTWWNVNFVHVEYCRAYEF